MSKWYGNVQSRMAEGKNFNDDSLIHEGDDITMYYYSDTTCYYVTRVIDQKHIFVKRYSVCADWNKELGMGHQDWLFFKTHKEMTEYLKEKFPDTEYNETEPTEEEWVYKNNKWKKAYHKSYQDVLDCIKEQKEIDKYEHITRTEEEYTERAINRLAETETNKAKLREQKDITEYYKLDGKISFGVRHYYYDWCF